MLTLAWFMILFESEAQTEHTHIKGNKISMVIGHKKHKQLQTRTQLRKRKYMYGIHGDRPQKVFEIQCMASCS